MKSINIIHLTSVLFISIFIFASCQKDNECLQINSAEPEKELSEYLDSIFTRHNNCLTNFENDTLFHFIFSSNNFENIDNCHRISQVDFNNYTLVVGKVQVSSISDKLESINLSSKNKGYKVKISIDKCTECYAAIGYLYFWKLYPKLNSNYNCELVVN
jgi:hypothetical protein